eukprot:TRINITY_DN1838_c0_g2_i2.p1 TRINITY_DN1838_c0_g2~~TRINITY_DN1838_c0_g2_i2.p1  ORF type:complete len:267 (-),score=36.33 TRINITY_DN1838_c0_g2_i2:30-830(-)
MRGGTSARPAADAAPADAAPRPALPPVPSPTADMPGRCGGRGFPTRALVGVRAHSTRKQVCVLLSETADAEERGMRTVLAQYVEDSAGVHARRVVDERKRLDHSRSSAHDGDGAGHGQHIPERTPTHTQLIQSVGCPVPSASSLQSTVVYTVLQQPGVGPLLAGCATTGEGEAECRSPLLLLLLLVRARFGRGGCGDGPCSAAVATARFACACFSPSAASTAYLHGRPHTPTARCCKQIKGLWLPRKQLKEELVYCTARRRRDAGS